MSNGKNFARVLFSIFAIGFFACVTLTLLHADGEANAVMRVHDRMPAIIDPADYALWLDVGGSAAVLEAAGRLMRPLREGLLDVVAVNRKLNDPRLEGPALQEPATG